MGGGKPFAELIARTTPSGGGIKSSLVSDLRQARMRPRRGIGVAHPGFLREPLVLGAADRAADAREKYRRGGKALAIGDDARGDIVSGRRASHHDGAHRPLPVLAVVPFHTPQL